MQSPSKSTRVYPLVPPAGTDFEVATYLGPPDENRAAERQLLQDDVKYLTAASALRGLSLCGVRVTPTVLTAISSSVGNRLEFLDLRGTAVDLGFLRVLLMDNFRNLRELWVTGTFDWTAPGRGPRVVRSQGRNSWTNPPACLTRARTRPLAEEAFFSEARHASTPEAPTEPEVEPTGAPPDPREPAVEPVVLELVTGTAIERVAGRAPDVAAALRAPRDKPVDELVVCRCNVGYESTIALMDAVAYLAPPSVVIDHDCNGQQLVAADTHLPKAVKVTVRPKRSRYNPWELPYDLAATMAGDPRRPAESEARAEAPAAAGPTPPPPEPPTALEDAPEVDTVDPPAAPKPRHVSLTLWAGKTTLPLSGAAGDLAKEIRRFEKPLQRVVVHRYDTCYRGIRAILLALADLPEISTVVFAGDGPLEKALAAATELPDGVSVFVKANRSTISMWDAVRRCLSGLLGVELGARPVENQLKRLSELALGEAREPRALARWYFERLSLYGDPTPVVTVWGDAAPPRDVSKLRFVFPSAGEWTVDPVASVRLRFIEVFGMSRSPATLRFLGSNPRPRGLVLAGIEANPCAVARWVSRMETLRVLRLVDPSPDLVRAVVDAAPAGLAVIEMEGDVTPMLVLALAEANPGGQRHVAWRPAGVNTTVQGVVEAHLAGHAGAPGLVENRLSELHSAMRARQPVAARTDAEDLHGANCVKVCNEDRWETFIPMDREEGFIGRHMPPMDYFEDARKGAPPPYDLSDMLRKTRVAPAETKEAAAPRAAEPAEERAAEPAEPPAGRAPWAWLALA